MRQQNETLITERTGKENRDSIGVTKHGILLVEDYDPAIVMMTMFFEQLGYECDVAKHGFDALDKFFMSRYDLVVMDLQLPDMDGLEITRRMRLWETGKQLSPTPIIGASGTSSDEDKVFCLKAGMNDYLAKPFQLTELETKLDQWLPPSRIN